MASNQTVSTRPDPLASMTEIGEYVFYYEPVAAPEVQQTSSSATAASSRDPKLVVIASWMDAQNTHIAKYVTRYQTLYPTSRILLVKFVYTQMFWESRGIEAVQPAVSYLCSQIKANYLAASPERPQILLHVFSNGGMASTKHLLSSYREKTGQTFPLHCAIYDSCPGLWTYSGGYNAIMAGIPKGIYRWLFSPFLRILNFYFMIMVKVLRRPYNLLINADFHNNMAEVRQSNRAYIYGQKDKMVEWTHVERHARQAVDKGYHTRTELFADSPHVAHLRTDEPRYLRIVRETWEEASRRSIGYGSII
ncbi:hypothetical protein PG985_008903 [Apiospora marii]|uniref:Indole-diterpene biosynthesis protein PaxU n=1 Tax=Apiospora marii TaxID=335849 RepID=A0ABR1RCB1_9PEZI